MNSWMFSAAATFLAPSWKPSGLTRMGCDLVHDLHGNLFIALPALGLIAHERDPPNAEVDRDGPGGLAGEDYAFDVPKRGSP